MVTFFVLIGCLLESKEAIQPNFVFPSGMFSITLIRLNGSYYMQWTQVVEVFLLVARSLLIFFFSFFLRNKFTYLNDELPPTMDPKYADWRVEDAQIQNCLFNSMESRMCCG